MGTLFTDYGEGNDGQTCFTSHILFLLAVWHVRSLFPRPGLEPHPLQGKHRVLTTGPLEKSQVDVL